MSTNSILDESWSDYDDRKKRGGSDHRNFACTESWEVDYLVDKIRKRHPHLTSEQIKAAISVCCKETKAPHPRPEFVRCVLKRLGLS
jgi:hypothetical protein